MFNCNDLGLLTFTYYLKFIIGILMTIIPFITFEKIYIQTIRYKEKYKKIDKFIIKKDFKNLFYTFLIFILAFTLHNTLNNDNNKCYIYANYKVVNEYKNAYNDIKNKKLSLNDKNIYLENLLITSYNNLNKKDKQTNKLTVDSFFTTNINNSTKNIKNDINNDNFLNETDSLKLNKVYVENGIFYYPKYLSGNRSTYSGTSCPSNPLNEGYNNEYGYNNYFFTRLTKFIEEANENGYKITYSSQGCRNYDTQVYYYNTMTRGRAAYPGYSFHGFGIASDLEFYQSDGSVCGWGRTGRSCPSMGWAHENADKFGLVFPLLNASYREDWHIEPINKVAY